MTLRGLIGAGVGFLAALTLVLCLSETRERFGRQEWGIWWYNRTQNASFAPIIFPLLYSGSLGILLGYFLGDRVRTWRALMWSFVGAAVVTPIGLLIPTGWHVPHERAEWNLQCMLIFALVLAGGALGAGLWDRFVRRRGAPGPDA